MRRVIRKRIRHHKNGVEVAADINAVISTNVGERGSHSRVSSHQSVEETIGDETDESRETRFPEANHEGDDQQ